MTMLAVPLPPKSDAATTSQPPVHRLTWCQCIYAAMSLLWVVVLAHFIWAPPAIGWWAVLLIWAPAMAGIHYGVSSRMLHPPPPASTPTSTLCNGCGELWPRQFLRVDDGLWCPTCEPAPVSIELDNDLPATVEVAR